MTYTTFKDVLDDILEIHLPLREDDKEAKNLGALARVYLDALDNPPEGVIGVGAVTYAEEVLVEYQRLSAEYQQG